jgi:hypothetical protein
MHQSTLKQHIRCLEINRHDDMKGQDDKWVNVVAQNNDEPTQASVED